MTQRLGARALALGAATLTAACGSSGPATAGHRVAEPSIASVQALRARVAGPVAVSPVIADGAARAVALAVMRQVQSPAVPQVLIYDWGATGWRQSASLVLDIGGSVAGDNGVPTPIATADLTPAKEPELLVTVHYNAGPATAVLSRYGGRWHALMFSGGLARGGDERFDVQVHGPVIRSHENDCIPNCAQGRQVVTTFRFNPGTGRLEAAGRRG